VRWLITNDHGELDHIKNIADIFAKYGIKTFSCVNFAAQRVVGNLTTFDPLNQTVISFWRERTDEIYRRIPNFGGFVVKANAEGEPSGRRESVWPAAEAAWRALHLALLCLQISPGLARSQDGPREGRL
jgi:alpha-glucuronidase